MDRSPRYQAYVGAGLAIGLSLLVLLIAGGGPAKVNPSATPSALSAPTPTLDPVSQGSNTEPVPAATQVKAPSQATPTQHKESQ
jgi:hypothetical protein